MRVKELTIFFFFRKWFLDTPNSRLCRLNVFFLIFSFNFVLAQNALCLRWSVFPTTRWWDRSRYISFAVSFPFSFKFHKCRVAQQTGGSEIEIFRCNYYWLHRHDHPRRNRRQMGIFFFYFAKRLTKGLYCVFYTCLSYLWQGKTWIFVRPNIQLFTHIFFLFF